MVPKCSKTWFLMIRGHFGTNFCGGTMRQRFWMILKFQKMRENAKNSKTISMKRKSIFVKLIFRHAIMRNIINVKTPLHGIKQTDAAPHHSICMIYVWKCCRFFPPHPKMPPTSKLEKGWKTSLPACLLRFRSFGCHLTGSTAKTWIWDF